MEFQKEYSDKLVRDICIGFAKEFPNELVEELLKISNDIATGTPKGIP